MIKAIIHLICYAELLVIVLTYKVDLIGAKVEIICGALSLPMGC